MKSPNEKTLEHAQEAARLATVAVAAMRVGVSLDGLFCDNFTAAGAPPTVQRAAPVDAMHFDAGRDAYRDGFKYRAEAHPDWRRGWIHQQAITPRETGAWRKY